MTPKQRIARIAGVFSRAHCNDPWLVAELAWLVTYATELIDQAESREEDVASLNGIVSRLETELENRRAVEGWAKGEPDRFFQVRGSCRCEQWAGLVKDDSGDGFRAPKSEVAIAQIAEHVANGHLPHAALDAVWAAVEGTLQYYSQDQCNDVNRYDNEKDAADAAEDTFGEACDDGWDDGVEGIEYGIIIRLGGARATGETSKDQDGNTVTEYEMVRR